MNRFVILFILGLLPLLPAYGNVLDRVKDRGFLNCGVPENLIGFGYTNDNGHWSGFDVDVCRALSAAIFGNPNRVNFFPQSSQSRFYALDQKKIDVLSRLTAQTLGRDTFLKFSFSPPFYYDGKSFMVHKQSGIKEISSLNKKRICVLERTTTQQDLKNYFLANDMEYTPVLHDNQNHLLRLFTRGDCDAFISYKSILIGLRLKIGGAQKYEILSEQITDVASTLVVRHGDEQWRDIVTWTVYALIAAENLGINSKNVDKNLETSKDQAVQYFLGKIKRNGKGLGLSEDWAYNIIKLVGNYKEIFDRNLGKKSVLKLERGYNRLWNKGGLLYAPALW